MGAVYRCHNRDAPKLLAAVKVLGLPEASERFRREAEILCGLDHPNIVRVRDFRMRAAAPYLVMDLVEGESLEALIERRPMAPETVVSAGLQLARALEYAHSRGIYHRDIKPANAILTGDGRVVLVDFGIAVEASAARLTTNGTLAPASVSYAPPEWLDGHGIDPVRWDVYSLGVVLFELLTRTIAFPMEGAGSMRQQILRLAVAKQKHPPLDPPDADPALRELIVWMTRSDPALRAPDMGAVVSALSALPHDAAPAGAEHTILRPPVPSGELLDRPSITPHVAPSPYSTPTAIPDVYPEAAPAAPLAPATSAEATPVRVAHVDTEPPSPLGEIERLPASAPTFDIAIHSDPPPGLDVIWDDSPSRLDEPPPLGLNRPPKRALRRAPRWPLFAALLIGVAAASWWFGSQSAGDEPGAEVPVQAAPETDEPPRASEEPARQRPRGKAGPRGKSGAYQPTSAPPANKPAGKLRGASIQPASRALDGRGGGRPAVSRAAMAAEIQRAAPAEREAPEPEAPAPAEGSADEPVPTEALDALPAGLGAGMSETVEVPVESAASEDAAEGAAEAPDEPAPEALAEPAPSEGAAEPPDESEASEGAVAPAGAPTEAASGEAEPSEDAAAPSPAPAPESTSAETPPAEPEAPPAAEEAVPTAPPAEAPPE